MTERNFKAASRLITRAQKMATLAIGLRLISAKRQRIEEIVDNVDAAAERLNFWRKDTKPVLMNPVPNVNLELAIYFLELCIAEGDKALTEIDLTKLEEYYRNMIRLAFMADEYLRNWKTEGIKS